MKIKRILLIGLSIILMMTGCAESSVTTTSDEISTIEVVSNDLTSSDEVVSKDETDNDETSDYFTDRDMHQEVDLNEASQVNLESGQDLYIENEGIYLLTGAYESLTIYIDADDEAKVQLILNDLSIVNEDKPAIYVKSSDKVFEL